MMSHLRETSQYATQLLFAPLIKVLLLPVTKRHNHHLPIRKHPYLIVANHVRGIDPFVICAALPYRNFAKLGPVNFMTKNIFYNAFRPLAVLFGCYPARVQKGAKIYGVDGSVQLLDQEVSVLIFPEGKCVKPGMPAVAAHSGVTRIHQARPHVPILLCHISYHGLRGLWRGQMFRVRFKMASNSHYSDPNDLLAEIKSMPNAPIK